MELWSVNSGMMNSLRGYLFTESVPSTSEFRFRSVIRNILLEEQPKVSLIKEAVEISVANGVSTKSEGL